MEILPFLRAGKSRIYANDPKTNRHQEFLICSSLTKSFAFCGLTIEALNA